MSNGVDFCTLPCVYGSEREMQRNPDSVNESPYNKRKRQAITEVFKTSKKIQHRHFSFSSKRVWIGLDLWIWNLIFVRFCLWFWRSMNVAMWLIIERTSCLTFGPFFRIDDDEKIRWKKTLLLIFLLYFEMQIFMWLLYGVSSLLKNGFSIVDNSKPVGWAFG